MEAVQTHRTEGVHPPETERGRRYERIQRRGEEGSIYSDQTTNELDRLGKAIQGHRTEPDISDTGLLSLQRPPD